MRSAWTWIGWSLLGVVAVVAALWTASRLWPVPQAQVAALAQLDAPPPPLPGPDGFAALWAVARDVPATQAPGLLAEDIRRFAATSVGGDGHASVLAGYPALDAVTFSPAVPACGSAQPDCLGMVRSAPQAYGEVVRARRVLTARIAALDAYGGFRNPYPPRPDMPLPAFQPLTQDLTVQAFDFIDGHPDQALAGVCRDASLGRKLAGSGDALVATMIGAALVRLSGQVLVDMLAQLPADHPLPAQCGQVFAPDGGMTAAVCPAMLGEGRYVASTLRMLDARPPGRRWNAYPLVFDQEKTVARGAPMFTWPCAGPAQARLAAGLPLQAPAQATPSMEFDCVANYAGCVLGDIAAPAYGTYVQRLQDTDAQQRLVAVWLWLRAQPATQVPLAERLAALPPELRIPGRTIRVEGSPARLSIALFTSVSGAGAASTARTWSLPVPAWMAGPAPVPVPVRQAQPAD